MTLIIFQPYAWKASQDGNFISHSMKDAVCITIWDWNVKSVLFD